MNRRYVLAGIVGVIAMPALAQTTQSPTTGQLTQADKQHILQTLKLGTVSLDASRIALQKAQNSDLKQFAGFEVQEQTFLSEVLHSMLEPGATAGTDGLPASTDAQGREMIQQLQVAQPGSDFDRRYLQGQLEGHRALLQVQERYLQSRPQNREGTNITNMARGQILEHIALLEGTHQKMG
jgi:putative membrane protein